MPIPQSTAGTPLPSCSEDARVASSFTVGSAPLGKCALQSKTAPLLRILASCIVWCVVPCPSWSHYFVHSIPAREQLQAAAVLARKLGHNIEMLGMATKPPSNMCFTTAGCADTAPESSCCLANVSGTPMPLNGLHPSDSPLQGFCGSTLAVLGVSSRGRVQRGLQYLSQVLRLTAEVA